MITNYATNYSSSSAYGIYNSFSSTNNNLAVGYKDISKINPFPKNPTLNDMAKSYISKVQDNGSILLGALSKLNPKNTDSVLKQNVAVSSNTNALTTSFADNKAAKSSFETMSIGVSQIATTQKNTGNSLSATENNFGAVGSYNKFSIEVNGKSSSFDYTIGEKDTNRSIQTRIADKINASNMGVKASVVYDATNKTSTLSFESTKTGTGKDGTSAFSVSNEKGNFTEVTNINNITQAAKDAKYTVNGEEQTSKTNDVKLSDKVNATLIKATDTDVKVSSKANALGQQNAVRELVNGFNGLMEAADSKSTDKGARNLATQLAGAALTYNKSLSKIGIGITSEGYLKIDEDKMKAAAEDGSLAKYFNDNSNSNYGFVGRMNNIASNSKNNAKDYLSNSKENYVSTQKTNSYYDKQELSNSLNISYSSRYTSMLQKGSLISSLFGN